MRNAKERRFLRIMTVDEVFCMCDEFLTFKKTSKGVFYGKRNEMLWKVVFERKDQQAESVERWMKLTSKMREESGMRNKFGRDDIIGGDNELDVSVWLENVLDETVQGEFSHEFDKGDERDDVEVSDLLKQLRDEGSDFVDNYGKRSRTPAKRKSEMKSDCAEGKRYLREPGFGVKKGSLNTKKSKSGKDDESVLSKSKCEGVEFKNSEVLNEGDEEKKRVKKGRKGDENIMSKPKGVKGALKGDEKGNKGRVALKEVSVSERNNFNFCCVVNR